MWILIKGALSRKGYEELSWQAGILCWYLSGPFLGHPLTACHDHLYFSRHKTKKHLKYSSNRMSQFSRGSLMRYYQLGPIKASLLWELLICCLLFLKLTFLYLGLLVNLVQNETSRVSLFLNVDLWGGLMTIGNWPSSEQQEHFG